MLCTKCFKKIPQGEEIHVKDLTICKKCANEPFSYCATCPTEKPIYYYDKFHECSTSRSETTNILWVYSIEKDSSGKEFQCDKCYKKGREDLKKVRNGKIIHLFFSIFATISLVLGLYIFRPKWFKKLGESHPVISLIFILSLFLALFILMEVLERTDRHKARERSQKKKSKQH